jgi:hypothetical protein
LTIKIGLKVFMDARSTVTAKEWGSLPPEAAKFEATPPGHFPLRGTRSCNRGFSPTFQRHWILWSRRMRSVMTHTGGSET